MNKTLLIILSIISALIILFIGIEIGIAYQAQKISAQQKTTQEKETSALVKQLSSNVIAIIAASGKVTNINGKNITLSNGGDSITIKFVDSVLVSTFFTDSKGIPTAQQSNFGQIKVGDSISADAKMLSDGTLSGQDITIYSSAVNKTVDSGK